MLDINSDDMKKFKKEVDDLTLSMQELKANSVVNLKVSAPSEKTISRLADLKSVLQDFKSGDFSGLSSAMADIPSIKSLGTNSLVREIESLSDINVSSALGNLRDITVAYEELQTSISTINNQNVQKENNQGDNSLTQQGRPGSFSDVSRFIKTTNKADPEKISSLVESLKGLNEIKVDRNTSVFMESVAKIHGSKIQGSKNYDNSSRRSSSSNMFRGNSSDGDIVGVVTTTLALLGSGVFLKRQANVAKEVSDLLALSEITGLDSFSNRAGIQALGVNPAAAANQQRQMSRELIGARLFGDVDSRKLILHNMLGTNFESSQKEMLSKALKLSPKIADYVLSQLGGDELAVASSRLRNAHRGASQSQTQSLNSLVFGNSPEIDVGSYTRFYIHFEGFFAQTKTFFQLVLQPSIRILESAFEGANNTIRKLMNNKKAVASIGQVISAFVGAIVSVFEIIADGLLSVGKFLVAHDMVGLLTSVASGLGYIVAGGLLLRTLGLATSFFTSLLGIRSLIKVVESVMGMLGVGVLLGKNKTLTGGGGGGGGISGVGIAGGALRAGAGIITVALATTTISELAKLWSITGKTSDDGVTDRDKWAQLLKTTGAGTAAVGTGVTATGAGVIPGLIMTAVGAGLYAGGVGLENAEEIVAAINNLINVTEEQGRATKEQRIVLETKKGSNGELLLEPIRNQIRN